MLQMAELPSTRLVSRSSLYATEPLGPRNQPDYINAVAELKTALPPLVLLRHLQCIEQRHRRRRLQRWGKRTLDLDILIYGSCVMGHPRLRVPHPSMHKREFVLIPLNEINPRLVIPRAGKIKTLVARLDDKAVSAVRKLPDWG
jgi:2-amino-4-hydroxy-6-hydroxymethyldihydropteridine diphosphokinase